ncbi:MAG: NAD-dependent epimerase/dehydratase family protein [Candidatus Competibacteraceae bacterium]|nr:NAD-dependent epimerase/dehydratase family protein [Candidatus Competibacteraceae bacterium]MCB1806992.1 NAD-dependent epimerase/dehydratase family protein [Candidatus Competibacteraceae bacterium]MCB1815586.1 NAD-dependent epimerase/dehydratase family protein [Candidatus Competibacteraceae bacterium]
MRIIITGGGGFIGKKLALELLRLGSITDADGNPQNIREIVLADIMQPEGLPDDRRLTIRVGDFSGLHAIQDLLRGGADLVFHLAAVVSGGAEEDFELGMNVNLHGSLHLLEALRAQQSATGRCARLVFASSVAVYGGDLPDVISDDLILNPQTSYGVQKAATELLINDYSRRGFIDGRALRLPTIVVRPGKPNKALSSFCSSIVREPLQGQDYVCPVNESTAMWVMSPRRVVEAFIHAAELPAADWGSSRSVALPGITITVREILQTLREIGGENVVRRIRFEADPKVEKVVYGWAQKFQPARGLALGFQPDRDLRDIVQAFIEDELGGDFVS